LLALALIGFGPAARADDIPVPQPAPAFGDGEYRLGAGDLVEVFVWKEPDLTSTVVVRPDGKISLPLLGDLHATGKSVAGLQTEISAGLRRFLAEPVVNVILKEVNAPKISILGNVRKPDVYKIQHKLTVLDAIALAGGFTDFAKRDRVMVIRTGTSGTQKIRLNLKRFLEDTEGEAFYLQQFDTVYVE
jgi:polysaccharide export outer membrane protein